MSIEKLEKRKKYILKCHKELKKIYLDLLEKVIFNKEFKNGVRFKFK